MIPPEKCATLFEKHVGGLSKAKMNQFGLGKKIPIMLSKHSPIVCSFLFKYSLPTISCPYPFR